MAEATFPPFVVVVAIALIVIGAALGVWLGRRAWRRRDTARAGVADARARYEHGDVSQEERVRLHRQGITEAVDQPPDQRRAG